jgi:GNAT superfamily N-acetyltransferase
MNKHRHKRAHKLVLRHLALEDYDDVKAIMDKVYATMGGSWTKKQIASQLARFPEGQICIENKGRVVAVALSLIVRYADWGDKHTYAAITGNGYFTTHDPKGDTLYGVDLFVDPDFRDLRLGRRLYDARKELCEKLNLCAIVAGGRIPGYEKHMRKMSPRQYIELVKNKELHDLVLSFQLANEFHVRRIITDYEPLDRETQGCATLLEWINIYFEDKKDAPQVGLAKEVVRIGAVQWQMRPVGSFDDLMRQIEFFIDAVARPISRFCRNSLEPLSWLWPRMPIRRRRCVFSPNMAAECATSFSGWPYPTMSTSLRAACRNTATRSCAT